MRTDDPAAPEDPRLPVSGEAFTRRAITVITAAIVIMTFAFTPAQSALLLRGLVAA